MIVQRFDTKESGCASEFFLNAQKLVVLGNAIGARRRSGLDLSHSGPDGEICNKSVFGFPGAMADDGRVSVSACQLDGLQRLRDCPNLVHLDQNAVSAI